MANRTKKGNVTSTARKKYGTKKGGKKGSFPVFDEKSARSAIRLRGHGNKAAVLNKVANWARRNKKPAILKAVQRARAADRKK